MVLETAGRGRSGRVGLERPAYGGSGIVRASGRADRNGRRSAGHPGKTLPYTGILLLFLIAGIPTAAMGAEYTYSFVHLSDVQTLTTAYPSSLDATFTGLNSLQAQYNISAVFITGDLTNEYDGGPGDGSDFARYRHSVGLSAIPVYEIAGNHDVPSPGAYAAWDLYVPAGSTKHDYGLDFNDFRVYGFGWNGEDAALNPTAKTAMQGFIAGDTSKMPLILIHGYLDWGDLTYKTPGASEILNSLSRNSIIMFGHSHAGTGSHGFLRTINDNGIGVVEDFLNYQDWGDYSAGRLYTVTTDGSSISGITVSDIYLYPTVAVMNTAALDFTTGGTPPPTGSITVTAPANGASWAAGSTQRIRWTSSGDVGSYVNIELLKGGILVNTVATNTDNDGSFSGWVIPNNIVGGTDYQIKITSAAAPSIYGTNTFTITSSVSAGSIAVTSAPSGAKIYLDDTDSGKTTPYTFTGVMTGSHTAYVTLSGYVTPAPLTKTVTKDTTTTFDFPLTAVVPAGSIAVSSVPPGAEIYLDGNDNGHVTPYTIPNVLVGDHSVTVALAGYLPPVAATVPVANGQTATAAFTLVRESGSVAVTSSPAGARILLDGTDTANVTPFTLAGIPTGSHTVSVTLTGYSIPSPLAITVSRDAVTSVDFPLTLIPPTGSIAVTSSPPGARIFLDGADTANVTPYTLNNVAVGDHLVYVTLTGYTTPVTLNVPVANGQTAPAAFTLVRETGSVSVTSTPAGAKIFLDGTDTANVTPFTLAGIPTGDHTVYVTLTGYATPAARTVTVTRDTTSSVDFPLIVAPPAGTITVTAPNGGEAWKGGTAYRVTWTSGGSVGSYVKIELLKGNAIASTLTPSTSSSGSFRWTVPLSLAPGSDYRIRVTSTTDASISDTSNAAFGITPAGTITVTAPNGGQSWNAGTTHRITWTSSGSVGSNVNIDLMKGDAVAAGILSNTRNSGLYSSWKIPASLVTGSDYRVRVSSVTYPWITDLSNTPFTITSTVTTGSIAVTSTPPGAEIFLDGADTFHVTPYTLPGIVTGSHTVSVTLDGYVTPDPQTKTVAADSVTSCDFTLTPAVPSGSIAVTSTPSGARIFLDGSDTANVTPFTLTSVAVGDHAVSVTLAGYVPPAAHTVPVVNGQTATAAFILVRESGSVAVTSSPAGARIFLDGTDTANVTPFTLADIPTGSHTVSVTLTGYYTPAARSITVSRDAVASVEFPLTPIPPAGSIAVTSSPPGARIFLDGADTANITPYTLANVAVGDHSVYVILAGYVTPVALTVPVANGQTSPAAFALVRESGSIAVTSSPSGARIFLDGTDTKNVTPYTMNGIPTGSHTVAVTLPGYSTPSPLAVTVSRDAVTSVDFPLTLIPPTGSIAVTSSPAGAGIFLDGTDTKNVTPYTMNGIPTGSHTVSVTLAGYGTPSPLTVTVANGQTAPAAFTLLRETGSITVTSVPAGAKIFLDGADTANVTPYTFTAVPTGSHAVYVTLAGYSTPGSQTNTVTRDTVTAFTFTLNPSQPAVKLVAKATGTSDGVVGRSSGSGETLPSLRSGAGTGTSGSDGYMFFGITSGSTANMYTDLGRAEFLFDTSGLPDNANIINATLSVWSGTSSQFLSQLGSASYGVTGITPVTRGTVSQGDYQKALNNRYADKDIPQASIANYNYNSWAFNTVGLSSISRTGWTNLTVRMKWDIDADTTGLTWSSGKSTQILLYGAEGHSGKEPTLTIYYSVP